MDESQPPRRMKGTTVCLPIAYGSIAWPMTKRAEHDQCTHQWSLYVRSPYGYDLGKVLKKVVFTLHPSFNNHIREVAEHPYEVTEKGWGEFETLITLDFQDAHEKSVELRHFVKLFHGNNPDAAASVNKKPVVHEYYDEVVFTDPTEGFYEQLQRLPEARTARHTLHDLFPLYSDVDDIRHVQAAHEFVTDQLRTYKDKLLRVEAESKDIIEKRNNPAPPAATTAPAPAPAAPAPAAPAAAPAPAAPTAAAAPATAPASTPAAAPAPAAPAPAAPAPAPSN